MTTQAAPGAPASHGFDLPANLPAPKPDPMRIMHLNGHPLPILLELPSTSGETVDLFNLSMSKPVLLFAYPRTGEAGRTMPAEWDAIPGARGCTPHLCAVRDSIEELKAVEPELQVFGLSTQTTEYQAEAHKRLHLPYHLLSDAELKLQKALDLPTFQWEGETLLERCTYLLRNAQVDKVDYLPFPSDTAAKRALSLLKA